jgi:hypothetical protein
VDGGQWAVRNGRGGTDEMGWDCVPLALPVCWGRSWLSKILCVDVESGPAKDSAAPSRWAQYLDLRMIDVFPERAIYREISGKALQSRWHTCGYLFFYCMIFEMLN